MSDINVHLYPNTSAADSLALGARTALHDALTEIITYASGDSLDDYTISIHYDHPNLPAPNRSDFKDYFELWSVDHASGIGVHIGISSEFNGGEADSGEWDENAFVTETEAVAGTTGADDDHFRCTVIQEALHPFIDSSLPKVNDMLGSTNDEHALGKVHYDTHLITPMVHTYYGEGLAGAGDCWGGDQPEGKTYIPTACTCEAMVISHNQRG